MKRLLISAAAAALTNGEGDVVDVPCVSRDSECVMTVRDINGNQYELTISGLANKGILVR